jgi:hypothetical protein
MTSKRSFLVFVLAGLLAAVAVGSTGAAPPKAQARLTAARSFAFAIGDGALNGNLQRRYRSFDLVIVDGESASDVAAIRRPSGALVLVYLDVGTIEDYRDWYNAAKPYRLDYWGEWYAPPAFAR